MKNKMPFLMANGFALAAVMAINTLANVYLINGLNTGEIADLYPSLFTPAGFTFSIWGVIYLLLFGFIVIQFWIKDEPYFKQLSGWFWLSCALNCTWLLTWHYLLIGPSVGVMLLLLYALISIFRLLQKHKMQDKIQWFFVKLPFLFYLSWICVATIANISTWLVHLQWSGGFLTPEYWVLLMVAIAACLGLFIAFRFKEPAFLLVLMWAFFGIYSRWMGTEHELIANGCRIVVVVLGVMFFMGLSNKSMVRNAS